MPDPPKNGVTLKFCTPSSFRPIFFPGVEYCALLYFTFIFYSFFLILNPILATADDIPRCYYNVFFIYYDKFSLEVQPISEFPAPINCPSLFRFGFDLEPEIWEYFLLTDKTVVLANDRINCGFPGITKVTLLHCRLRQVCAKI